MTKLVKPHARLVSQEHIVHMLQILVSIQPMDTTLIRLVNLLQSLALPNTTSPQVVTTHVQFALLATTVINMPSLDL
jgi:hypothetical protein